MRRSRWWSAAGLFVVALGGAAALALPERAIEPPPSPPVRPVRVTTVEVRPADEVARYAAVIRPRIEAQLGFRVDGKILERLVDVGARVEAGQALATLDPDDLELAVRAAEAQLVSARAEAANAERELRRYRDLRGKGWSTPQEVEARTAASGVAEARVREVEAQLRVARNNATYGTLRADRAGIITAVLAEPGQVVEPSDGVFRLARAGELEAVAEIPEQHIAGLDQAQLATELWAQPGSTIAGQLRELAPSANAQTRTYTARVRLDGAPTWMQLGMTATLTVVRPRSGIVARVPRTALTHDHGVPAVWVLNDAGDGLQLRPVAIATFTASNAIVAAGLRDGERVVTAGVHKLDAGQKVRVWVEPQR